jgi:formamidopyrimidine-DNA glycosylase
MPELPDIAAYLGALEPRVLGETLTKIRINSPFLLRSVTPPVSAFEARTVRAIRRVGKRIALGFDGDLWLVLHLMIAGRLQWKPPGAKIGGKYQLAAFDFPKGSLLLTEAGSKRCASLTLFGKRDGDDGVRSGRRRCVFDRSRHIPRGHDARESHIEALADRSANFERHRKRVFR